MQTESDTTKPEDMNQNQTESKPPSVEEPADEGLDETTCSPCDLAYRRFHDERRVALESYIEKRTRKHVKSGGNDSPSYRMNAAYDGMRDLPGHSDRDIWNAAWKACLANA
jgi:hypothetical protein